MGVRQALLTAVTVVCLLAAASTLLGLAPDEPEGRVEKAIEITNLLEQVEAEYTERHGKGPWVEPKPRPVSDTLALANPETDASFRCIWRSASSSCNRKWSSNTGEVGFAPVVRIRIIIPSPIDSVNDLCSVPTDRAGIRSIVLIR